MDIKYVLAQLRKAGLSQKKIGDEIGCSQPTISDMEAGRSGIKRPSYKVITGLTALCAKHGVATEPEPKRRKTDKVS